MIKKEDLNDPLNVFFETTESIGERILILQIDLLKVTHYYSKAIIEKELEDLKNEYVARSFKIQEEED